MKKAKRTLKEKIIAIGPYLYNQGRVKRFKSSCCGVPVQICYIGTMYNCHYYCPKCKNTCVIR